MTVCRLATLTYPAWPRHAPTLEMSLSRGLARSTIFTLSSPSRRMAPPSIQNGRQALSALPAMGWPPSLGQSLLRAVRPRLPRPVTWHRGPTPANFGAEIRRQFHCREEVSRPCKPFGLASAWLESRAPSSECNSCCLHSLPTPQRHEAMNAQPAIPGTQAQAANKRTTAFTATTCTTPLPGRVQARHAR